MSPPRQFNPDALKPYAVPWLLPNVGNWSAVWRYTVLVPVEQIFSDNSVKSVASDQDRIALELMLIEHFGGITRPPQSLGIGARDPKRPRETHETNRTKCFRYMHPSLLPLTSIFRPSAMNCKRRWPKGKCLSPEKMCSCFDAQCGRASAGGHCLQRSKIRWLVVAV